MSRILTLTGGLDSTWVLHKLINTPDDQPAEAIYPVYLDFNQGQRAAFLEYLLSSEAALRMLKQTEWYKRELEWRAPAPDIYNYVLSRGDANTRLVQQGNVVMCLANVMNDQLCREQGVTAFVGWNKGDCIERNLTRGEYNEDDYNRLRRMYEDLVYFQDHGYRVHPLLTPAWDKTKHDMWKELPPEIRPLITVAPHYAIHYLPCPELDVIYIYIKPEHCAKYIRYREQGIELSVAWRISTNSAFWDRVQQKTCPVTRVGYDLPKYLCGVPKENKKPEGYIGPLRLKADSEPLIIKAYGKEEWDEYYPKLEKYIAEREAKARTVDGANGEVAQGASTTTTGPAA